MRTNETHLYVLEQVEEQHYVGITGRPIVERLREHTEGHGAAWTREYPVTNYTMLQRNVTDAKAAERWTTLLMMKLYGWQNVRGGGWTRRDLSGKPKDLDRYSVEELAARVAVTTIAPPEVASVLRENIF